MGEYLSVAARDGSGSFGAYVARPDAAPRAAVVVVQEIFGINAGIRTKVDRWADLGYVALAPDMFWRFRPGYDVDPDVPEQMKEAFDVRAQFDPDSGAADLAATIRLARDLAGARKVGVVGYCLGGRMAYLCATRTDADACVGYYGAGIDARLEEAKAIANPLMLHFAGDDHLIPPESVDRIEATLAKHKDVSIFRYPGVDHGFAATSGKRRSDAAAREADARTEAFIRQWIG